MTTYELANSLPKDQRSKLVSAGLMTHNVERYIYIYELFVSLTESGLSKMDAYAEISAKCYTCEENVRKIVRQMGKEVNL